MPEYNDKANKKTENKCILPQNSDSVNIGPAKKYASRNNKYIEVFPFLINIADLKFKI